jgi:hypothetical protein
MSHAIPHRRSPPIEPIVVSRGRWPCGALLPRGREFIPTDLAGRKLGPPMERKLAFAVVLRLTPPGIAT